MQDLPMLAAGLLASLSCGVIGCFLVLRRMSLMGDAISHAVLPGIIGGFLLHWILQQSGITTSLPLLFFAGAVIIGVITAALSELIHRLGKVEPGASMGVVFTVLFAIGVIMLAQVEPWTGGAVHLDAECVLYGAMETVLWMNPPSQWSDLLLAETWNTFPRQITTLVLMLLADVAFIAICFKELRISAFDPGLAKAQGISPGVMHYLLMTFVATTTVASFEAVGSILVVAMLIIPGLVAHLLADRLATMVWLSAIVAILGSGVGYGAAAASDANAAGMIGVTLGVLLGLAAIFAPRYGWINRKRNRHALVPLQLDERP